MGLATVSLAVFGFIGKRIYVNRERGRGARYDQGELDSMVSRTKGLTATYKNSI
jgi:hypothetical protein